MSLHIVRHNRVTANAVHSTRHGGRVMYIVQVKAIAGWTTHSEHESLQDATDQSDMVHGRIIKTEKL